MNLVDIEDAEVETAPHDTDAKTRRNPLDGFDDLSKRTKAILISIGVALAYFGLYNLPGIGDFVEDKVPYGVVFIGVVQGTTTALLAMGLILIYRTNRFVNFSYAAMGALPGAFALGLHLEHGFPFFAALALAVVTGVLLGLVTELVIRRFKNSSRLIVTVASIGLAQLFGVISLLANKSIGFLSLAGGFTIPIDVSFSLVTKTVKGDEILIIGVVPLVIIGLAFFLLRTDAGVAIRAAAENEDRALLLGIPVYKLGRYVWMIAGGLAALTYVLQAPSSGVAPNVVSAGPAVLLPALAAAVVARLESLPIAFFSGIGLGVLDQLVRWNATGTPSITSMFFLAVILVALLLQRASLSRAMNSESASFSSEGIVKAIPRELRNLPEVKYFRWGLSAVALILFIWVPYNFSPSQQFAAAGGIIWAIVGVSLVMLTGFGGHISLGQFAIAGMGGLVAGNLLLRGDIDFFIIVLVAGATGSVVSLIVGLPALRIRGLFLAVSTLAFAVALNSYVLNPDNFPSLIPSGIVRPILLDRWDMSNGYPMYAVCLFFLVLAMLVARSVRGTRSGRVIIGTRDNERAADSASVATTRIKLQTFMIAGFVAGVAGALDVTLQRSIGQGTYAPEISLEVFSTAVIGGLGSIPGAVAGVLLFRFASVLNEVSVFGLFSVNFQEIRLAISGIGLLLVLVLFPGGLAQIAGNFRDKYLRLVANRRDILVPSLVADKRVDGAAAEPEESLLTSAMSADDADDTDGVDTIDATEVDDDQDADELVRS